MWSQSVNRRRLQLALVVAVSGLLIVALLDRAERLAGEAERIAVELHLRSLNNLATLRYVTLLAHDGVRGVAAIEGANPMAWEGLVTPDSPAVWAVEDNPRFGGYLGELSISTKQDLPRGRWAFDPDKGLLFYRFRFRPSGEDGGESSTLLGFRAQLIFDDVDTDGHFDADRERASGARVIAVSAP